MIEAQRRAYLEALGIDVWLARGPAPEPGLLQFGSGRGSTLLLCGEAADSATRLAGDIVRAIGQDPVWAWPAGEGQKLEPAIAERLISRIIVFGEMLARELFSEAAPGQIASATVGVAPGLDELAIRGAARKALWALLEG